MPNTLHTTSFNNYPNKIAKPIAHNTLPNKVTNPQTLKFTTNTCHKTKSISHTTTTNMLVTKTRNKHMSPTHPPTITKIPKKHITPTLFTIVKTPKHQNIQQWLPNTTTTISSFPQWSIHINIAIQSIRPLTDNHINPNNIPNYNDMDNKLN